MENLASIFHSQRAWRAFPLIERVRAARSESRQDRVAAAARQAVEISFLSGFNWASGRSGVQECARSSARTGGPAARSGILSPRGLGGESAKEISTRTNGFRPASLKAMPPQS